MRSGRLLTLLLACVALAGTTSCGEDEEPRGLTLGTSQEAELAYLFTTSAGGDLWFPNPDAGHLTRVDASSGEVEQVIDLVEPENDFNPRLNTVTTDPDGDVWIPLQRSRSVVRLDISTDSVAQTLPVDLYPYGIAATETDLWISDFEASVVIRVDQATGRELARISTIDSPMGIVVTPGAVWVESHREGTIFRIDPATAKIVGRVDSLGMLHGMAADDDALWVASTDSNRLVRIDLDTLETESVVLDGRTYGVAVGADGVWVTTSPGDGCNETNSAVVLVDPDTLTVLGRVPLACAFAIAAAPDGPAVAATDDPPGSVVALKWNG